MTFIKTENKNYTDLSDNEVIELILKEGKKNLLEVIYDRYVGKIYYKASSLVNDKALGKDLTHDIMVKVLMNLSKYSGTGSFSLWINSITYNYCMDYLRKQKRMKTNIVDDEYFAGIKSDNSEFEYKVLKEARINQLNELFTKLLPDEKMIMIMRYKEGLSIRDISVSLNLKEGAIKMRLKRSRAKLVKLLNESDYEE